MTHMSDVYSPEKLTCPLKNSAWKITFLLKCSLFRGCLNFRRGVVHYKYEGKGYNINSRGTVYYSVYTTSLSSNPKKKKLGIEAETTVHVEVIAE